jgi:hypothetical protein
MLLQYIRASELLLVDKLDGLSNFNISLNNCSYINDVMILYTIAIPSDQVGIDMVMNALLLVILIRYYQSTLYSEEYVLIKLFI